MRTVDDDRLQLVGRRLDHPLRAEPLPRRRAPDRGVLQMREGAEGGVEEADEGRGRLLVQL